MKTQIENMKKIIQTYEEKRIDYTLKEKKWKSQLIDKEKKIKKLEAKIHNRKSGSFIILNKDKYKESLSNNSSICSRSCSKTKITDEDKQRLSKREISPLPFEKSQMMEKLDKYKKLIDKKVSEVTRNKSQIARESSCASILNNSKERTMDNELSLIASQKDLTQRINETAMQGLKNELQKNTISVKKIPLPDNTFSKNEAYQKKKQTSSYNNKLHKNNQSSIPIVINHSEVPCVNNINIYAGNTNAIISDNGQKSNQVNLRQYIFTKCTSNNLMNKIRSISRG